MTVPLSEFRVEEERLYLLLENSRKERQVLKCAIWESRRACRESARICAEYERISSGKLRENGL